MRSGLNTKKTHLFFVIFMVFVIFVFAAVGRLRMVV